MFKEFLENRTDDVERDGGGILATTVAAVQRVFEMPLS
jgi:hypothetical protein